MYCREVAGTVLLGKEEQEGNFDSSWVRAIKMFDVILPSADAVYHIWFDQRCQVVLGTWRQLGTLCKSVDIFVVRSNSFGNKF